MIGPKMKPRPNAMPIKPILRERSAGGVMSDGVHVNFAATAHQRDESGKIAARNVAVHDVVHAGEAGLRESGCGHDGKVVR
jgi:hypothetical protein